MPVPITCKACGTPIQLNAATPGKREVCPRCNAPLPLLGVSTAVPVPVRPPIPVAVPVKASYDDDPDDGTPIRRTTPRHAGSPLLFVLLGIAVAGTIFSVVMAFQSRSAKRELADAKSASAGAAEQLTQLEAKHLRATTALRAAEADQKAAAARVSRLIAEQSALSEQLRAARTDLRELQTAVASQPPPRLPLPVAELPPVVKPPRKGPVPESDDPEHIREYKKLAELDPVYTFPPTPARAKAEIVPGYFKLVSSGFTLIVSREVYDQSDKLDGQPLGCLASELQLIASLLPDATAKALAKVPIWVEWDHILPGSASVLAVYFGLGSESLGVRGIDPQKGKCVCIQTLRRIYLMKSRDKLRQTVLLHELAHAVHDRILGDDSPLVVNAYKQAMTRGLYAKVEHLGGAKKNGYATTNDAEYFAELSCCYLDKIDYYPFKSSELRDYDSPGYELMTRVWGTPEQIAKAKLADADRKAKYRK